MEILFELLFQLFGEMFLQIVAEFLFELGIHSARETFNRPPNPWLAAIGYAIFGVVAGGLSLLLFPALFIGDEDARFVNLVLTPLVAGFAMALLGTWRRRHDQGLIRLDKFSYGYLFAVSMALVRFVFGH